VTFAPAAHGGHGRPLACGEAGRPARSVPSSAPCRT